MTLRAGTQGRQSGCLYGPMQGCRGGGLLSFKNRGIELRKCGGVNVT